MTTTKVRIGTWNAEWAVPGGLRGERFRRALESPRCDVLCLTEGYVGLMPSGGHVLESNADYGYTAKAGRRKVLLWSKQPWTDADSAGSKDLPGGRFASGVTETPVGSLTIVGVCIPWRDAHVRTGRRNRTHWEDHLAYLAAFEKLPYRNATTRTVVLGDFNQRIPRKSTSKHVHSALLRAIEPLRIATQGEFPGAPALSIDHLAHTLDLESVGMGIWPMRDEEDDPLSDHFGVWCDFYFRTLKDG